MHKICIVVVNLIFFEFLIRKYKKEDLRGGHIIMLGKNCDHAAISALQAYPHGMQIGGNSKCSWFCSTCSGNNMVVVAVKK